MNRIYALFLFSLFLITLNAENYYICSNNGSDNNNGLTIETSWKSLKNVNNNTFNPGDSILFARNGVWFENLSPEGSGISGRPIIISSYGKGNKPLFVGSNAIGRGVITLYNQSFWEISQLEIVNNGEEYADRRGIEVLAENSGIIRNIHLEDLYIHHVKGIPGNFDNAKRTAGIFFGVTNDKQTPTRFDNILIENCIIHDIVNQGIALSHDSFKGGQMYPGEDSSWNDRKFTNVIVRNNIIYNISKNAMIIRMTEGGVIENNICFNTATGGTGNTMFTVNALKTIFQYNEGFLNKSHDHDGSMYDPDLSSPETIWRYSYSHDNAHGLLWICTRPKDCGIIVYNNISENDHGFLNYFNYGYTEVEVSNNIYLSDEHVNPFLIRENPRNKHGSTKFNNNVIINKSDGMTYEYRPELISDQALERREFLHNHFLGKPLSGNYISTKSSVPSIPYIHRGLHKTHDDLNKIYHQQIPEVTIIKNKSKGKIIATINNIPVYEPELIEKTNSLKSYFYSISSTINQDLLCETAINDLFLEKLQLELMKKKGLKVAEVLSNIETYYIEENNFRKKHIDNDNVIFYGPETFNFEGYRTYIWANAIQYLKEEMVKDEIKLTEKGLREFFLIGDLDRFDSKWADRGFEYSLAAIKTSLIDKKYNDFFSEKLKNANIEWSK